MSDAIIQINAEAAMKKQKILSYSGWTEEERRALALKQQFNWSRFEIILHLLITAQNRRQHHQGIFSKASVFTMDFGVCAPCFWQTSESWTLGWPWALMPPRHLLQTSKEQGPGWGGRQKHWNNSKPVTQLTEEENRELANKISNDPGCIGSHWQRQWLCSNLTIPGKQHRWIRGGAGTVKWYCWCQLSENVSVDGVRSEVAESSAWQHR